ncbi:MAG: helix-turn-helix domain-containing protein [Clostridiales bacterium]|nr:helix-turn-helix domain-containing protein [Clostridiales bacterium]
MFNLIEKEQLDKIGTIVGNEFGMIDEDGKVLYYSAPNIPGKQQYLPPVFNVPEMLSEKNISFFIQNGYCLRTIFTEEGLYFLYCKNVSTGNQEQLLELAAIAVTAGAAGVKRLKNDFYRKLLLEGGSGVDAVELSVITSENRDAAGYIVILAETEKDEDTICVKVLREIFPEDEHHYVVLMGGHRIAIICSLNDKSSYDSILKETEPLADTLRAEAMVNAYISVGVTVQSLKDIDKSYVAAVDACEIGKTFEIDNGCFRYDRLGIFRLVYGLETESCVLFLKEVLGEDLIRDKANFELLTTVRIFLDNNQNVSETARALYIHRNTLIYRLDKINKLTGMDCTLFENGMKFRLALMIIKYLKIKAPELL